MRAIAPHLWFDREAVEAAELYTSVLPGSRVTDVTTIHDTPSGDSDVVSFELCGQPFMAISAGPHFRFTPAISFLVRCRSEDEVDELWDRLAPGGRVLMPLDPYPFSARYGWTEDRYGLSWQIMLADDVDAARIVPTLAFAGDVCGRAEEAIELYVSVFGGARRGDVVRYGPGEEPAVQGTIKHAGFFLDGVELAAMDAAGAHDFGFNEAISFAVLCDDQAEIDYYWERLSAVPEAEQCGWLKDRFGVSWQIVPAELGDLLAAGTAEQARAVTRTFLAMKKLDIAALRRAYRAPEGLA